MEKQLKDFLLEKHGAIYNGKPVLKLPSSESRKELLLSQMRNDKYSFKNYFEYYRSKIIERVLYSKSDQINLMNLRSELERKSIDNGNSFIEKDFLDAANCVWNNYFYKKRR